MKVQPLTDFPEERLGTPGPRWLQAPAAKVGRRRQAPPVEVQLESGRTSVSKGREVWLVKVEGIDCPEDVGPLRGHTLLIPAAQRAPLDDADEFYVQDLVGLAVVMRGSGEEVGEVVDLFDGTGTHDVLRIRLHPEFRPAGVEGDSSSDEQGDPGSSGGGGRAGKGRGGAATAPTAPRFALLPFVKALVPVVDLRGKLIEVAPPEGLFELATAGAASKAPRRESAGQRERRKPRPKSGGGGSAVNAGSSLQET